MNAVGDASELVMVFLTKEMLDKHKRFMSVRLHSKLAWQLNKGYATVSHTPPPPGHGHGLYPSPCVDLWWPWVGVIDGC